MKAYLMSQGLWGYAKGTIDKPPFPTPVDKDGKAKKVMDEEKAKWHEAHDPWKQSQDMAQGSIMLRLSPSIQQNYASADSTETLWDNLQSAYDVTNVPTVYKDFKEIISFHINPNQHPTPQFDCLSAAFGHLGNTEVHGSKGSLQLPEILEGLIALAFIPHKWEHLVPIITTTNAIDNMTFAEVRQTVISQYETETNKGQHKAAAPANANKLSAVKQKHSNPCFTQQDHSQQPQAGPSNPNQQQQRQCGSRGSGCGGKAKGKSKQCDGHSHVASVAFVVLVFTTDAARPPPSTSTVTHFGASLSMVTQTISQSPPTMKTKGVYPSVNKVILLLECMEVRLTIQTTKMLEEHFLKLDNKVHHHAGYYEDDYSSDEDMLQTVLGPSHEIFTATPSDLADLLGESIAHDFEYLSIDGVIFDPPLLDKENHALMLPYISPQSVATDLGHSDPEAE